MNNLETLGLKHALDDLCKTFKIRFVNLCHISGVNTDDPIFILTPIKESDGTICGHIEELQSLSLAYGELLNHLAKKG